MKFHARRNVAHFYAFRLLFATKEKNQGVKVKDEKELFISAGISFTYRPRLQKNDVLPVESRRINQQILRELHLHN